MKWARVAGLALGKPAFVEFGMGVFPLVPGEATPNVAMMGGGDGGCAVSVLLYREGKLREADEAELEFVRRASLRHALTREILGRYEDALFGLSAIFRSDGKVSPADFARETAEPFAKVL